METLAKNLMPATNSRSNSPNFWDGYYAIDAFAEPSLEGKVTHTVFTERLTNGFNRIGRAVRVQLKRRGKTA